MCTDLTIQTICPVCQTPQHTRVVYRRGCAQAMALGRAANDFVRTFGACGGGLARESRTRAADRPCGLCRWKAWVRARQQLRGVDFWQHGEGGRRSGGVVMMTRGGWRVIG